MKVCTKCGLSKTLDSFSNYKRNKDGKHSNCKECRNNYYKLNVSKSQKEIKRLKKRNQEKRIAAQNYIRILKNNPCVDCGNIYPYYNMQFDHLEDKEWTLGRLVSIGASLKQIDKEIKKCELVCVLCHGDRTHIRRLDNSEEDMVN